jgi:hypothetical protein
MSAEVFLLFALVVIYCVISLPGDAGQTRAMRRRQHSSVYRTTRIGILKIALQRRSDGRNRSGGFDVLKAR